jgi:hypothetical protein
MDYLSNQSNASPVPSLYLVAFDDWGYDQYDAFLVVACSEEEADMLTPQSDVNYSIGISLGYDCPKPDDEIVEDYRDYHCGEGKSIRRIGEALEDIEWGEVPVASYNAG